MTSTMNSLIPLLALGATLPDGIWLIGLLPVALVLHRIFVLAFVRRAEVFVGKIHDTSNRFGTVGGAVLRTSKATPIKLDNGISGSVRDRGDAYAEVALDHMGVGQDVIVGFLGTARSGQHEVTGVSAAGKPGDVLEVVPEQGSRHWLDCWMATRVAIDAHGIWIRETGMLFRPKLAGQVTALTPRAAAAWILYDDLEISREEIPVFPPRGFWDLLIPGAVVFLFLYPLFTSISSSPAVLYTIYVAIMLVLWGCAIWLDSIQRDRVAKWLHLINRNTGLNRWNAFILTLVLAVVAIPLDGGRSTVLPLALVIGTAIVISWARCTSAPWRVKTLVPPDGENP